MSWWSQIVTCDGHLFHTVDYYKLRERGTIRRGVSDEGTMWRVLVLPPAGKVALVNFSQEFTLYLANTATKITHTSSMTNG